MESIQLNDGSTMPTRGFGTWMISNTEGKDIIKAALKAGYRHIDCAYIYNNEVAIGQGLKEAFQEGIVRREEVYIVSKIWCKYMGCVEDVVYNCQLMLKNLQIEYLDLLLVHVPFSIKREKPDEAIPGPGEGHFLVPYDPSRYFTTWQGVEECVKLGLARSIGVSNMTSKKLEALLSRELKIKPVCNQVELHPYLPQRKLLAYCKEKGIPVVASTALGNPNRPEFFRNKDDPSLFDEPVLIQIAEKHKKTVAQVLQAWHLVQGRPVIAKSSSPDRMKENLAVVDLTLDDDDLRRIDGIKTRFRVLTFSWAYSGMTADEFWDDEYLG